ncbi:MAG: orotidine-5'-phosphate decarboxylase [Candidatus Moranbacteria bacterium]|nr:orotidine-5'-phosphate decarboxylase [Candidatus Moranbacteria bacterium]
MPKTFVDKLIQNIKNKNSILCVGLDPQIKYLPRILKQEFQNAYPNKIEAAARCILEFNQKVIDNIFDIAVCVKPQIAFYEQYGSFGLYAFEETIKYAQKKDLMVLADVKRGDGGDTALAYSNTYLGKIETLDQSSLESQLNVDAVTLNISIGSACLDPFIEKIIENQKAVFAVVKTSFKPNSEIENFKLENGQPVWEKIAEFVNQKGEEAIGEKGYQNLGAVIGATYPKEAKIARKLMPKTWFLVPGYGAQGAAAKDAVAGIDQNGRGVIVNSARGITASFLNKDLKSDQGFEKEIRKAAIASRNELNEALK